MLSPVLVADDTTEYTLIIAEENKGHKTASRDSHLEGFAPSIPGTHDELGLGIKITDRGIGYLTQRPVEISIPLFLRPRAMFIVHDPDPTEHAAQYLLSYIASLAHRMGGEPDSNQ